MATDFITCPKCNTQIPLTQALAAHIEAEAAKRSESIREAQAAELEITFEARLQAEVAAAESRAGEASATKLADLANQVEEHNKKLLESRQRELDLLKRQRELEEHKATLDLDFARRLDEERQQIRSQAAEQVAEEYRLKEQTKDEQLAQLKRQIEDLKRKAEQGSQQVQGEGAELQLEELLRATFPVDTLEPVSKGVRGADLVHRVNGPAGSPSGVILWEAKNTKNWSDAWLSKLRDDQRAQKADVAVLVSTILPPDCRRFGLIDSVWVTDIHCAVPLASALRAHLIAVHSVRTASAGQATKSELLYTYLSGNEFRQRVEALIEAFSTMRQDLDKEKAAIERLWAKREKLLTSALTSVAGMYGDVQGIIGKSLPDLQPLELAGPSEPPQLGA